MEPNKKKAHPKKVLRASLAEKLQPMLHDIKESFVVNEKKLEKLVKKAAKILSDGLHIHTAKSKKATVKKKTGVKKTAVKKVIAPKKRPVKKTSLKK